VSPVRYEQDFHIPEDGILHSHGREKFKYYIALTGWALAEKSCVSCEVRTRLFYIPKDDILYSHHRENLKPCMALTGWSL
jgi:hypothetical protein